MIKKKHLAFLLILIIISSAIVVKLAFSNGWFVTYLSVNSPVSPELLIVEGWVSDPTIQLAAKEFHDMGYTRILTSGSPTDPNYLISEDGYLEFSFINQPLNLHKYDTISFILSGTPAQGTYPEYLISVNDQPVETGFTSGSWKTYTHILDSATTAEKISISFINDAHYMGDDRNLQVKCLNVNHSLYLARSSGVLHYDKSDQQRLNPRSTNFGSVAELCAHKLQKEGIPHHQIEVVPSPVSGRNRTLASAIVLSEYLYQKNLPYNKVNIISEGIHARRTWLSYKFALRNKTSVVGIICVPPARSYHTGTHSYTNKEILKELTSIVYYTILFNKNRYRKRFIREYRSNQRIF
jgi:hypothetical protein